MSSCYRSGGFSRDWEFEWGWIGASIRTLSSDSGLKFSSAFTSGLWATNGWMLGYDEC